MIICRISSGKHIESPQFLLYFLTFLSNLQFLDVGSVAVSQLGYEHDELSPVSEGAAWHELYILGSYAAVAPFRAAVEDLSTLSGSPPHLCLHSQQ